MAKKLSEFLKGLIAKAGQSADAEALKTFLDSPDISNIEAPDELVTALDNNLLSIKDAQNNHPDIKRHYTTAALNGVDAVINELVGDDDELRTVVSGQQNTFKKIPLLVNKIKELEGKKAAATSQPNKDAIQQQKEAYQKQLDQLTFDLKTAQVEKDKLKENFDKQVAGIKIESKINHMLGNYKTIYDDLDPEVKGAAINALMNKELINNDAEFFFDEKGNFSIRKKDGTNFLAENHQQIMPQAFVEQLLSRNKLLKVTTTDQQDTGNNSNQANGFSAPNNVSGNGKPTRNHALADLVKSAQADLAGSASAM